jgi:ribosome-associated toxin RatA of RatAB toxin-antitoxin module
LEPEGLSFWTRDLSESGLGMETAQDISSSISEADGQSIEFNIVINPTEDPVRVVAKAVWTRRRSTDGTLSKGWNFTDYHGDGKEQLAAFIHANLRMQRIQKKDEMEFDFSPPEIYRAIVDSGSYSQWWPALIRHKILNSKSEHPESPRIEISPFGISRFCCEIETLKENEKITYRYYEGACVGIGMWILSPKAEKTLLSYEIDLAIQSRFVGLASIFIDLRKLHSGNMR